MTTAIEIGANAICHHIHDKLGEGCICDRDPWRCVAMTVYGGEAEACIRALQAERRRRMDAAIAGARAQPGKWEVLVSAFKGIWPLLRGLRRLAWLRIISGGRWYAR